MRTIRFHCMVVSVWVLFVTVVGIPAQTASLLPMGEAGIAANYPGDVGMEKDPAVIFTHGFEDVAVAADLRRSWDAVFHDNTISITVEPRDVHSGRKALELTFPQTIGEVGNGLMKHLTDERDVLFLRYYQKFEKELDVGDARSFHNGGSISARYQVDGRSTPGKRADGQNKFLASYECTVYSEAPSPGNLTMYIYHPEQRSDYGDIFFPTGVIQPNTSLPGNFGEQFLPRPDVLPELDRWHCYEFMVKANTVGQRDGRIACWLDGNLVAEFPNMRLRDVDTLKIDYFTIGGYIHPNPVRTNRIWFDDVVVATSYIGPQHASNP